MENLPLYLKHRPSNFSEFIGNESTVESLQQVINKKSRQVRAFLFYGPSGTGKTTLARILKAEFGCSDKDFMEYNSSNTRGIDTIREIIANSIYAPLNGKVKIYLLDEVHKMTGDAQNALLKTLEDTPDHIRFILCTTEPEKLLVTIRNRCMPFQLFSLNNREMMTLLKKVAASENINAKPTVLREISKVANGSARKALVLLEQISDCENDETAIKVITSGIADETKTIDLCRALLKKDWAEVSAVLKGLNGVDPENIRYAVLGYFTTVLLSKGDKNTANTMTFFVESFIPTGKAGLVLACFFACH